MCGGIVVAQKTKPWTEWSKKDAEKMLNDSAWGQTQTVGGSDTPMAASVITPTASNGNAGRDLNRSGESGEVKASKAVNYRVRFLTAKPIREAVARTVVLSQTTPNNDLANQLQGFVDRDFGNFLVLTLSIDSEDTRMGNGVMTALGRLSVDSLKDKVYLERKDGKRLSLVDYKAPIADNMGAKFIFERTLDGQPFVTQDAENLRVYMELNPKVKVNLKFKVSAMLYSRKLEI